MIVVKLELHSALTGQVREIGRAHIFNDGTGTRGTGNYGVRVLRKGTQRVQREGRVEKHPRLSAPVWSLLRKALEAAGY